MSPPMERRMLTRSIVKASNGQHFYPMLSYFFDNAFGVKEVHIFVILPSTCGRDSVVPSVNEAGTEVVLTYLWEDYIMSMFSFISERLGEAAKIAQRNAAQKLLYRHGDVNLGQNKTTLTIPLPFKCSRQFYTDPIEYQRNPNGIHRGYYVKTKELDGGRTGVLMLMKLKEVENNVARFARQGIHEESLDEVIFQEEVARRNQTFQNAAVQNRQFYPQQPQPPPPEPPQDPPPPQRRNENDQNQQQEQLRQHQQALLRMQQQQELNQNLGGRNQNMTDNQNFIGDDDSTVGGVSLNKGKDNVLSMDEISTFMKYAKLSELSHKKTTAKNDQKEMKSPEIKIKTKLSEYDEDDLSTVIDGDPSTANLAGKIRGFFQS